MKKMLKKSANGKLEQLGNVLEVFIFLYGVLMIFALIISLKNGKTHLSIQGMGQVLIYTSISAVGVIVCLTDIIFSKVSASLRLTIYGGLVYIASIFYFKNTAINPFYNSTNFIVYTLNFAVVCGFTIFMWTVHENSVKKNYDELIKAYQLTRE